MDLKGIMLSEISQRKTNTIWFHIHVESKKEMNRGQSKTKRTEKNWWLEDKRAESEQNGESGQLYSDGW